MAMSKEKRELLTDFRRKQILEAALVLFLEKGINGTTMQDIADKAGISKGLIYRYFSSKNEILEAEAELIEKCEEECAAMPTAIEALKLYATRLLSDSKKSGYFPPLRLYIICFIQGMLPASMQERYFSHNHGREYFGKIMRRGQAEGTIRDGDPEELGDIFWNYLLGATAQLVSSTKEHEYEPKIRHILDLFKKES